MDLLSKFINDAPSEIIQALFERLPVETLHSLAISNNRRLQYLASQHLWRDRVLHGLDDLEPFVEILRSPTSTNDYGGLVESLTIHMSPDRDDDEDEALVWSQLFSAAIPKLTSLRRLEINFADKDLELPFEIIPVHCPQLTHLEVRLWGCAQLSQSFMKFARALDPTRNQLRTLIVDHFSAVGNEFLRLVALGSPLLERLIWEQLQICTGDLGDVSDDTLVALAGCCPQLRELVLHRNELSGELSVTDVGVSALASGCGNLEKLAVLSDALNDTAMMALAGGCPHLKFLEVLSSQVTDAGMMAVVRKCGWLKELKLRSSNVTFKAAERAVTERPGLQIQNKSEVALSSAEQQRYYELAMENRLGWMRDREERDVGK